MAGYSPMGAMQSLGGLIGGVQGYGGFTQQTVYTQATNNVYYQEQWNTQYQGTATINYATSVWYAWNEGYQPHRQPQAEATAAQVMAAQKAVVDAAEAAKKAEELLLEHLSPVQRESYLTHGLFIVETKKNRYQLHKASNTRKLNKDGKATHSYCIHTHGVPRQDELLGFKLLLEANEEEFLKTANATAIAA